MEFKYLGVILGKEGDAANNRNVAKLAYTRPRKTPVSNIIRKSPGVADETFDRMTKEVNFEARRVYA